MNERFFIVYQIIAVLTTLYLTFLDGYAYTALNWIIVIPINIFLGEIWPLYWAILRWVA